MKRIIASIYSDQDISEHDKSAVKKYNVHIELTDGDVCDFIVYGAQWNPLYKILEQSDLVEHYVVD